MLGFWNSEPNALLAPFLFNKHLAFPTSDLYFRVLHKWPSIEPKFGFRPFSRFDNSSLDKRPFVTNAQNGEKIPSPTVRALSIIIRRMERG